MIVAQGGKVGGWALYVHDGNLKYCVNFFGIEQFFTESSEPLSPGDHQVRIESDYDGGGWRRAPISRCTSTASPSAPDGSTTRSRWPFSADEGLEIGQDLGSPSSPDYGPRGNEFNGTIEWVQLDAGTDDHDHLISPEERFNLAMAKQ